MPRWPFLDLDAVKAVDSYAFAERCLGTLTGEPLLRQFALQKVFEITKEGVQDDEGALEPVHEKGGFRLVFNRLIVFDEFLTQSAIIRLLGLTFLHDPVTLRELPHTFTEDENDELIPEWVEDFLDTFMYLWYANSENRSLIKEFFKQDSSKELVINLCPR